MRRAVRNFLDFKEMAGHNIVTLIQPLMGGQYVTKQKAR